MRIAKKSPDIVFINQDAGYLMIDIINTYVESGYSCSLITGRLVERSNPLHSSVKISKIIRYNRNSIFKRLFTWIWATFQIIILVKIKYRKSKLFIVSNPPLAPLVPLLAGNSYRIIIFDIYPDAIIDSGLSSQRSFLMRLWKNANSKAFKGAERIFTITDSMQEVLQNYAGNKPVEVIPMWTDNRFLRRVEPLDNPFLKNHNLEGKFVVLYSGNIGITGQVDTLLEIAEGFRRQDIAFLFIGEGAKKRWLEKRVTELALANVIILPWQPAKELAFSLSSASLAVVGIDQKASRLAMPSKLLSYLSVGAPVLCLADVETDLAKFVSKYRVGYTFSPSQKKETTRLIEWLMNNPDECRQLSRNALIASGEFTCANAAKFL